MTFDLPLQLPHGLLHDGIMWLFVSFIPTTLNSYWFFKMKLWLENGIFGQSLVTFDFEI